MNDGLKPCPFCGGEAELYGDERPQDVKFVRCLECNAISGCYCTTYGAVKAWNMRQIPETLNPAEWSRTVKHLLETIADMNRLLMGQEAKHEGKDN